MKEDPVSELKTRLRQDAERVLETQNHPVPIAELLERHNDRKRRRILLRSAGLTLLAVVLPAAWVVSALLQPPPSDIATIGKTTKSTSSGKLVVETPPSVPESTEPNSMVDPGTTHASAGFVPIVLVRTNADGEQVFVPGLYIPERSESIDFSRLSQAQQRAVRVVLGLEKKPETRMPI